MINSAWQDCKTTGYGDTLQKIRIDATDPQGTPDVWLTLTNVPDSNNFVDEPLTYNGGYFTKDTNPFFKISDSGQWQIVVTARDSDGNTDTTTIIWNIPWGALDAYLISPTGDITVPKSGSFNVQAGVHCLDAECPNVDLSLRLNEPNELIYDDASAEDYGDIGSTSGFLAAKFKPAAYPAQLKTARFYVWDQTAYPFELHLWNDDGGAGKPGTELMPPLVVDPVAPSAAVPAHEVAWFDVDLSARNIVINRGEFYIGFRQIEGDKVNQLGFDMRGASYHPYARSWGFLPELGWFNLDEYCQWCDWLPEACEYCGNLMIRAIMSEPGAYSGRLPNTVGPAILYTTDNHPKPCPNTDMDPGQSCQVALTVHAVGAAGQSAKFHAVSANNYSLDSAGPVKVTITNPLTPCAAANLNAVGLVDFDDFAVLADQWLATAPPLSADIHIDGSIDAEDLARLADYWLTTCE